MPNQNIREEKELNIVKIASGTYGTTLKDIIGQYCIIGLQRRTRKEQKTYLIK